MRVAFGEPDLWEAHVPCRYAGEIALELPHRTTLPRTTSPLMELRQPYPGRGTLFSDFGLD